MSRILLALAAPLLLVLGVGATLARAEEYYFELEEGKPVIGWVVREDEESVRVRLTGSGTKGQMDIPVRRIVRRFLLVDPKKADQGLSSDWSASANRVELNTGQREGPERPFAIQLPEEEPSAGSEGFFHRLARVTVLAIPRRSEGRLLLAGLFFVALLVLVTLGGRVAEIDGMGLGRATLLSVILGTIIAVNVLFHQELMRADRAVWVLPLQGAVWLGTAMAVLRVGVARTTLLFAFVLFSVTVVIFGAGAILVSF